MTTEERVVVLERKLTLSRCRIYLSLVMLTVAAPRLCLGVDADAIPDLVAKAKVSVVTVLSYDDVPDGLRSQGSGWFIGPTRIVTNRHVLAGSRNVTIVLSTGAKVKATALVAESIAEDLVVLEVDMGENPKATPLPLAEDLPREGEQVVVIGSPLGLTQSVSTGIISSIRDSQAPNSPRGGPYLQTTAAISSGSSGSPILDLDGKVVAVATFKVVGGEQLNFGVGARSVRALKIAPAQTFAAQIENDYEAYAKALRRIKQGLGSGGVIARISGLFVVGRVIDNRSVLLGQNDKHGTFEVSMVLREIDASKLAVGQAYSIKKGFLATPSRNVTVPDGLGGEYVVKSYVQIDSAKVEAISAQSYHNEWREKNRLRDTAEKELQEFDRSHARFPRYIEAQKKVAMYTPAANVPSIKAKLDRALAELESIGEISLNDLEEYKRRRALLVKRVAGGR